MEPTFTVTRQADQWVIEFESDDTKGTATIRLLQAAGLLVKIKHGVGLYLDAWTEDGDPVVAIHSLRYGEN